MSTGERARSKRNRIALVAIFLLAGGTTTAILAIGNSVPTGSTGQATPSSREVPESEWNDDMKLITSQLPKCPDGARPEHPCWISVTEEGCPPMDPPEACTTSQGVGVWDPRFASRPPVPMPDTR